MKVWLKLIVWSHNFFDANGLGFLFYCQKMRLYGSSWNGQHRIQRPEKERSARIAQQQQSTQKHQCARGWNTHYVDTVLLTNHILLGVLLQGKKKKGGGVIFCTASYSNGRFSLKTLNFLMARHCDVDTCT